VSWTRGVFGPPGRNLGRSRWPLTAVIAVCGGIFAAGGGLWKQAALFFGAAAVLVVVTVWSYRR
jgi:hypothetical protein